MEKNITVMQTGRGVKAACCVPPLLVNLCSEKLMEEAFNDTQSITGEYKMKIIRYSDVSAITALN